MNNTNNTNNFNNSRQIGQISRRIMNRENLLDFLNVIHLNNIDTNNVENINNIVEEIYGPIAMRQFLYSIMGENSISSILNQSFEEQEQKYKTVLSDKGNEQLKIIKYSSDSYENKMCPIMHINFEDNEEVIELPCKHIFNSDGIKKWLSEEKAECPVCRYKLDSKEIINKDERDTNNNSQSEEIQLVARIPIVSGSSLSSQSATPAPAMQAPAMQAPRTPPSPSRPSPSAPPIATHSHPSAQRTPVPASPVPASPVPASSVPASSVPASSVPASSVPASPVPQVEITQQQRQNLVNTNFSNLYNINNRTISNQRIINNRNINLNFSQVFNPTARNRILRNINNNEDQRQLQIALYNSFN
jgi:hypothetical protein